MIDHLSISSRFAGWLHRQCGIIDFKFAKIFFFFFLLLFVQYSGAHTVPPALDSMVMKGKQHIYRMEFEQAEAVFVQSQAAYPDYPHGYVYQAYITALFFSLDQSNDSLGRALDEQLKHSTDIAKDYKDSWPGFRRATQAFH
jgi:hypothetical protein